MSKYSKILNHYNSIKGKESPNFWDLNIPDIKLISDQTCAQYDNKVGCVRYFTHNLVFKITDFYVEFKRSMISSWDFESVYLSTPANFRAEVSLETWKGLFKHINK